MFCGACYRKNFGPKGYGFGGGAGTLGMDDGQGYKSAQNKVDHAAAAYIAPRKTLAEANGNTDSVDHKAAPKKAVVTSSKPKWGGAEICPRCDKSVFIAELMRAAGKAWHKTCFTCLECSKRLDSSILCEREGEVYCKACYGRNFGPKGFGYGIGAGVLQMKS